MNDIGSLMAGAALVISQIGTTYILIRKSQRDARESREDRAENAAKLQAHLVAQDTKLVALHESTNGLSERAERLAGLLGEAKGKAAEKANPT